MRVSVITFRTYEDVKKNSSCTETVHVFNSLTDAKRWMCTKLVSLVEQATGDVWLRIERRHQEDYFDYKDRHYVLRDDLRDDLEALAILSDRWSHGEFVTRKWDWTLHESVPIK